MPNRYKYLDENKEHMHTLDGKPLYGTSTVLKIINKPLAWWAAGMALTPFGWMNPGKKNAAGRVVGKFSQEELEAHAASYHNTIKDMPLSMYVGLLQDAYRAHDSAKVSAGTKGTDRHEILEAYVKHCIATHDGVPTKLTKGIIDEIDSIMPFVNWAVDNIKRFLWSEVNCYSEVLWTGGIADVGWLDHQDRVVAGDFKSSKEAYFEQFLQIGGYDIALTENGGLDKDGNKKFNLTAPIQAYCIIPFGAPTLTPNLQYDVESFKEGFKSALTLHKLQTVFNNH